MVSFDNRYVFEIINRQGKSNGRQCGYRCTRTHRESSVNTRQISDVLPSMWRSGQTCVVIRTPPLLKATTNTVFIRFLMLIRCFTGKRPSGCHSPNARQHFCPHPNVIPQTHINISCTNTHRTWGKPWPMSTITIVTWLPSSSRSWLNTVLAWLWFFLLYCLPVGLHYPLFTASKLVEWKIPCRDDKLWNQFSTATFYAVIFIL